jgi:DNA ligase-1
MKVVHTTPVLSDVTSKGKTKYWQGYVAEVDGRVVTFSRFWQDGAAKQESAYTWVEGKNVGKKNETAPLEQAISDIESDMRKKEKKGYVPEGQKRTRVLPLPMLAHSYEKRAHDIVFPCHGQPKLDGVRCLTDGVQFWSREGNLFPELTTKHLQHDTRGMIVDGEIMLDPEKYTFEEIISALKSESRAKGDSDADPELYKQLQFYVFDIVDIDRPWKQRLAALRSMFARGVPATWLPVPTAELAHEGNVQTYLHECIERGHEGIILRNIEGRYTLKHRSKDLQKLKLFVKDAEFKIIGVEQGVGKDAETPIFTCTTDAGAEFRVRPEGGLAYRKMLWKNREEVVGKLLTVKYQNLTADGVPRFPVGRIIRDYE